jgi:hypothetical protein
LERTPKLVLLLRFLVDKYFAGQTDQLTEYNIAIEVFGRERTSFIASDDAIARVETHRLRKKLKAFYETEGRDHPIQIFLPLGTYVPVFTHAVAAKPYPGEPAALVDALEPEELIGPPPPAEESRPQAAESIAEPALPVVEAVAEAGGRRRLWLYALCAVIAVVLAAAAYKTLRGREAESPQSSAQNPAQARSAPRENPATSPPGVHAVAVPFRMIAGYSGPPQRDPAGDLWQADAYHHDGWAFHQEAFFIAGTNNPLIFRYGRAGDSTYDIPLKPGLYELHLYFLQASDTNQSEDAENKNIFDLSINGQPALEGFDIVSDAMGRNTADERVFRDVSPAADGQLHLRLSTVLGTPSISAIEILEGIPHRQQPIRIVTQPTSFTDRSGQMWRPDNYFLGGRYLSHNLPSTGAIAADTLSVERYGHFSYAIPVDPRDHYTVVLYFVELFFGTKEAPLGNHAERIFRVMCNGNTLLDNFDIYKEAGNFHMVLKSFPHIRPTAQGKLNLTFEPISNYATVSAIEVIDEASASQ